MFFNKKSTKKIDPKVRFQNRQFNQKLQEARTFKRTARPIPEGKTNKFLKGVGLGGALRQIGLALLVLAISYVVYFPNILTLQTIQIEGVRESDQSTIEAAIRHDIGNVPFYNPQRNLLFLSKNRVEAVLNSMSTVDTVTSINKDLKNQTLRIVVKPKQEQFLLRTNDKVFVVYNDGVIKNEAERSFWETNPNDRLIKIDIPANVVVNGSQQLIATDAVNYVAKLSKAISGIRGSTLSYVNIPISEAIKAQISKDELLNLDSKDEQPENTAEDVAAPEEQTPESINSEVQNPVVPVAEEVKTEFKIVDIQAPITIDELNIFMQKGDQKEKQFKVLLDPKEDPDFSVQRLNLLLSQTEPDRYNNLLYVDLRIENRAYVCLVNTVCSK